ncbi:MAG: hypothetical protein WDN29_13400 [Methylovirgula sp.]
MVELVLVQQVDSGDLAANGDDPAEQGEKAEARRGRLLTLRCLPIPGNVRIRLLIAHDQASQNNQ